MTVLKKQRATYPFVMTPTCVVKDTSISANSLRLYIYMLSLPDDWVFYSKVIQKNTGLGRDSYRTAMNALIEKGLIKRHKIKSSETGKFANYDYEIVIPGGESEPKGDGPSDDGLPNVDQGLKTRPRTRDGNHGPADEKATVNGRRETRAWTRDGFSGPKYILKDLTTNNDSKKEKKKLKQKDLAVSPNSDPETEQSSDDSFLDFFNFYKTTMGKLKSNPNQALRSKYNARIKDGFSDDELRRAVLGCKASSWHQGENPTGAHYNGLELILRNPEKVYDFLARYDASFKQDHNQKPSEEPLKFTPWNEVMQQVLAADAGETYETSRPDDFHGKTIDGEWE